MSKPIPVPDNLLSLKALNALRREHNPLAALEVFHAGIGPIFRASLPGFSPIMLAGADAARFVLIEQKDNLRWRTETDPITRMLGNGLLVTDGEVHDVMRKHMNPAVHRRALGGYVDAMVRCTDEVMAGWSPNTPLDMLVEMRRVALLITIETLFGVDFNPELDRLFKSILKTIHYIAPGLWMMWANIPRPGYAKAIRQVDDYLRQIIRWRRERPAAPTDLLGMLIALPDIGDDMIRDQLMTMIVAGHDTVTAMLAWTLYLLAKHPDVQQRAYDEVTATIGSQPPSMDRLNELAYLERVINESMRLYPPAHLGSRAALTNLEFGGYIIPRGVRVTYSIWVTHRMADYWEQPRLFDPDRFLPERSKGRPPFSYIPFGGGQRICIGVAFAEVEAKIVLARLLQRYRLTLHAEHTGHFMGATIEPRPGVLVRLAPR